MKRLMILLVVLLPIMLFAQGINPVPTGVYQTTKIKFCIVYDTKWHYGYVRQQEIGYKLRDSTFYHWIDLYYYEKKLLKTKRYDLWEIRYPNKW